MYRVVDKIVNFSELKIIYLIDIIIFYLLIYVNSILI